LGLGKFKRDGCFLIGSGPSLKAVDVTLLTHMTTIAFNRSYVAWKQWGFAPTIYVCLDPVVFEDNALEIRSLIEEYPGTHFFVPDNADSFGIRSSAQISHTKVAPGHIFSTDILALTDFGNVGATSIQILALLGYRRIAMIGIDARYSPVDETSVVTEKDGFVLIDDDPNHFCAEYVQGKRLRARPDLSMILRHWPQVAKECAKNSIEVRNASPGSALDCFPTTDFTSAIEWVLAG
jgi:hypothetical protein